MIEKFVIRLPKGLRNKIKHLSEQNRRSMDSEIIMVLEKLYSKIWRIWPVNLPEEKKQAFLELSGCSVQAV